MITRVLHNIGPRVNENYTPAEVVAACKDPLTFDGIYLNVWEHRHLLVGRTPAPILFVLGMSIGLNNSFDKAMPPERFCDYEQIYDLVDNYGCELGFHSWTHRNMTLMSDDEAMSELRHPFKDREVKHFAYPYGAANRHVADLAKKAGYETGWSVMCGDDSQYLRLREYL